MPPPILPFRLDPGGIEPLGTGLRIDFGRDRAGVIETVSRLQGAQPTSLIGPEQCGAGISAAEWRDGLVLVFQDRAFRGWSSSDPTRSANGQTRAGVACS
ncbi:hypothetical protein V8J82_06755 [Gymnodinialimonas sp. 2305UL16-5]